MAVTACTSSDEYLIYTGGTGTGTVDTPHAVYTDGNGEVSIQCNTVKLGGNGFYS